MKQSAAIATLAATLASVAIVAVVTAQQVPDFSGTWTMDIERSQSPTYPGFSGPVTLVITQTAKTLRVETRTGPEQASTTKTYTLFPSAPPESGTSAAKAIAYWEGETLVSEGETNVQGKTVNTRQRRTLQAGGDEMHLRAILIVQHGYTLEGTENFGKADDVYVRQR